MNASTPRAERSIGAYGRAHQPPRRACLRPARHESQTASCEAWSQELPEPVYSVGCAARRDWNQLINGFTLAELLVVIGIIAVLAGLLLASLHVARSSANSAVCKNNLRQYGLAFEMYVSDFGAYPPYLVSNGERQAPVPWEMRLWPYTKASAPLQWDPSSKRPPPKQIDVCPSFARVGGRVDGWQVVVLGRASVSYGYNSDGVANPAPGIDGTGLGLGGLPGPGFPDSLAAAHFPGPNEIRPVLDGEVLSPSQMIELADTEIYLGVVQTPPKAVYGFDELLPLRRAEVEDLVKGIQPTGIDALISPSVEHENRRHGGRWNVEFCDGHAETFTGKKLFDYSVATVAARWNRDNKPHEADVLH
jgi:prepilin-type N-terminal cleavage/methylation domain-containing protein/prepilin-type processing-associated H-X9-DG protein